MEELALDLKRLIASRLADAVREDKSSADVRQQRKRITAYADGAAAFPVLDDVLAHTLVTVPFYARYRAAVEQGSVLGLANFPILRRETLRTAFADLISRRPGNNLVADGAAVYVVNTSGSTGQPVSVIKTVRDEGLWDRVSQERLYRELGLPGALVKLDLSGGPGVPDLVQMSSFPRPAVNISLRNWDAADPAAREEYRIVLESVTPDLIFGSPLCILGAVSVLEELGHRIEPKAVITTYEHLSAGARRRIEDAFGCRVVNLYGTAEAGLVGWSCAAGRLHVQTDGIHVELLREDQAAGSAPFNITLTSLFARAMPILRYQPGDLTTGFTDSPCPCGSRRPALADLLGRSSQRISSADGRLFSHGDVDFHLDNFQVSEYQLIQQGAGEIVLILPARYAAQAAEIAAALSRGLAAQFEPAAELTIVPQATGKWHLTPRGKRNAIVRN